MPTKKAPSTGATNKPSFLSPKITAALALLEEHQQTPFDYRPHRLLEYNGPEDYTLYLYLVIALNSRESRKMEFSQLEDLACEIFLCPAVGDFERVIRKSGLFSFDEDHFWEKSFTEYLAELSKKFLFENLPF